MSTGRLTRSERLAAYAKSGILGRTVERASGGVVMPATTPQSDTVSAFAALKSEVGGGHTAGKALRRPCYRNASLLSDVKLESRGVGDFALAKDLLIDLTGQLYTPHAARPHVVLQAERLGTVSSASSARVSRPKNPSFARERRKGTGINRSNDGSTHRLRMLCQLHSWLALSVLHQFMTK